MKPKNQPSVNPNLAQKESRKLSIDGNDQDLVEIGLCVKEQNEMSP